MIKNERGQIQQVFIFILFIIVAGFVVILGYKAISGMDEDNCNLEKIQFKKNIVSMLENYDTFGSVHNEELALPCNFHAICFVEANVSDTWTSTNQILTQSQRNVVSTASATNQNIFIVGEFAEPAGYSEKVNVRNGGSLDEQELCVEGNTAHLTFRGKGRTTQVEVQ